MFCPHCGKQTGDNMTFCPYCGGKLPNIEIEKETENDMAPNTSSPYQRTAVDLPEPREINEYPIQDIQYTQPQRSANGILAGALTAVSILLVAACVLLFIKPGYLRQGEVPTANDTDSSIVSSSEKKNESTVTETEQEISSREEASTATSSKIVSSKAASSKVTSSKAASSKVTSSKAASSKVTSSKAASSKVTSSKAASSKAASSKASSSKAASSKHESKVESKPDPEPVSSVPEPEPEPESQTPSERDTAADKQAYDEAMAYSTTQRPTFDEFDWCYGQYGLVYDMPSTANRITNDQSFNGGWKCMVIYNPTNPEGVYVREINNASLYVQNGLVDFVMDWYMISNNMYAEPESEDDMKDTVFNGFTFDGGLSASNETNGTTIVIRNFWKENGYEYAVGTMTLSDGTPTYIAMMR